MFSKIEITGIIQAETGIHIGGNSQFAAIGAVDSPVIRDVYTDYPMIPGSSLKGKMRTLLAKQYNKGLEKPEHDDDRILRLFGSAEKGKIQFSRLIFSDMIMVNAKKLQEQGISTTEIKFENTINRLTAVAMPRQIERAVRGSEYELHLIYNLEKEEEFEEDMKLLRHAMTLLTYDYIGGHGSRGYGKISFKNLDLNCVIGEVDKNLLEKCRIIVIGE
ncbi:type III-A CRISPR-associated RAMP protein Csm3 [Filifactor alocis]|uniref:type III-A CRISPR-associated RAMP protein Csm3 n=1 Tax=Filifactor alocis TaxID=143361 RepID=UPI0028D19552|nr:type III-A CRISPR-associated RAMP protein Csm3 [Filifactor alocis]